MMRSARFRFFALLSAAFVALTLVSVDFAEARRGGSFGSRGLRTQQAAPPTRTAPTQTGPVERTMTPSPNAATRQQTVGQQRPGLFNGMGGSLMRGIIIGGLFGMLLGYGFGGMAGALGFLLQLLLIGVLVSLAVAWFRSRNAPAMAGGAPAPLGAAGFGGPSRRDAAPDSGTNNTSGGFQLPRIGGGEAARAETRDLTIEQADLDTFEKRLAEVQSAFAAEDHAALRRLSTPEMVSYFSEELADNAKRGVRNEVTDVHLVEADIAEAWSEGDDDYATAAFRYEAVDLLRDRATGELAGGVEQPTETVELWTFVRSSGGEWKLSAIQEA